MDNSPKGEVRQQEGNWGPAWGEKAPPCQAQVSRLHGTTHNPGPAATAGEGLEPAARWPRRGVRRYHGDDGGLPPVSWRGPLVLGGSPRTRPRWKGRTLGDGNSAAESEESAFATPAEAVRGSPAGWGGRSPSPHSKSPPHQSPPS
jgi:hypothetical protein